ncbi:MAG: DUF3793 family protein [Treponemataceae bacterium]|nr:DUF3793 family protein [Treponemataceae bacterium]
MSYDELIVRHCSATLAGIKPSNLVTLTCESCEEADRKISVFNQLLNSEGIYFRRIKFLRNSRVLVFVYNKSNLENHIFQDEEYSFIDGLGYPVAFGLNAVIDELQQRFLEIDSVPHEIGVFLGYPISDVRGFIENNGCNFKCACRWKVYGDEQYSLELCQKYCECEKRCLAKFKNGFSLRQLCRQA